MTGSDWLAVLPRLKPKARIQYFDLLRICCTASWHVVQLVVRLVAQQVHNKPK